MSNQNHAGISLEKIKESQKEYAKFSAKWWKKNKVVNWAVVILFGIIFFAFLIVSIFPIYAVKYKLAGSSFDQTMENKIIEDYYKDLKNEGKMNLPFKDYNSQSVVDDLNELIQNEAGKLAGDYGVYIQDLDSGKEYGLNTDKKFTAASLSKLFVAAAYYKEAVLDPSLVESNLLLKNEDRISGNGSTYNDPVGSEYQASLLMEKMLKESDNTAMAILTREVGADKVEKLIQDLGLKNTSFYYNDTSPYDMGSFLNQLYNKDILLDDNTKAMLDNMQNTSFEDRLPYYLPAGTRVAHKIGNWDGAYSDAGIIYGKNKNYIIVVMTENANYEEAVNFMRKISQVVYNYFNS